MTTNLINKNNFTMMKTFNLNRTGGRFLTALVFIFSLGITNAWAGGGGGTTYKTDFKATGGVTGKGYVYASEKNSDTPAYVTTSDDISESVDKGENGTSTYYAWAKAVRGHEFNGWTLSNTTKTTDNSGVADVFSVTAGSSTVTGVVTATWTDYTSVNVTYNPSEDGVYSVTYQYNSYNSSSKEITAGDAENLSRDITSENGAQTIGSYYNDVITLTSTKGTFQGWYSDAGFNTLLSTANPYTYVAPQSGTVSIYAKYPHVDKYYGRLTVSIAAVPYSMPAGGMIFITKEAAATPAYSDAAQTVDNVGMGSTSLTYYLKAQPTDKRYVFRGWYDNAECAGTPLSTNKEYTYSFTASSTNSASPTTGNIYAAFDFNLYYMQVEATTGTSSAGLGMVLVRDNNTGTPEYGLYSTESSQFAYAYRLTPTTTVYLYAKPKYGYKFSGWYDNAACTGTALSTENPYTYAATGTSTDPMNPTIVPVYAKFVEDATTVNITYNKPDQTKGEYTAFVLDIAEVDDEYIWTFTEVFTSVGKTANTVQAQHKTDVLRLEATPKTGHGVTSWTEGSTTKTTPSSLYETTGTAAKTVGVTFGDAKPFLVCSTTDATSGTAYATLREALDNLGSNKKIAVVQDAYVPAGDYTIPDGVRLYIPRAENSASKGKSVERSQAVVTAPTPYVTLTLGQGANIIVNGKGNIEVGAQIVGKAQNNSSASAGCNGAISGTYGLVVMNEGSTITLNGTSVLYAWGRITGKGKITANSGTTVYEIFQVTDWCGGSRAYACNSGASEYKMFPFSQYHIQNIEAPLRLKNGANEKLMAAIDGNNADDIPLVGPNNSSSMFRMNSSDAYIEKSYDAVNDRQVYRTGGTASINDFSMKVVITVSTTSFILPLTNNMSVYIESGTTSITTNAIVNADARIHIAEGATLEMVSGKSLYVYDSDDWLSGFVFNGKKIAPLRYSLPYATSNGTSSGTPIRTDAKIEDATILVNGTLNMKGKLYTSSGNAKIYSTATGKVIFSNAVADANTTVYHLNTISGSNFAASVATTYNTTMYPAKLRNGDDSFVMTANAAANDQFIYNKNMEQWMKNPKTITWNANGGTTEATTMAYSQDAFIGELPAAYRDGYTLAGWFTAASGGTQIAPTTKVTANVEYFAHWTPKQYNITYMDEGKKPFSGVHGENYPTKHTSGETTNLVNPTKEGFIFDGWFTISNCKETSRITSIGATSITKDITLYAKWRLYTITWRNMDGSLFETPNNPTSIEYNAKPAPPIVNPTYSDNTPKLYVFTKWKAESDGQEYTTADLPKVTADETYTAQYDIVSVLVVEGEQSISTETVVSTALLKVSGKLTVGATLTTKDLILEATPSSSGELVLVGKSNVVAENAYFEFSQPGGFKARTWYAVAVPWQVKANGGISAKKGDGDFTSLQLGSDIDLIYYRGDIRAASGPINECWRYVEDDPSDLLQQGRAYMFCLYTPADIVRFARKSDPSDPGFKTTLLSVETYNSTTGNDNDANWNGIANPATYHAYINANADAYQGTENAGQVYDADNKSYKVINLSTTQLLVGQPVFVQATKTNNEIQACAKKEDAYPTLAPRRAKAQSTRLTRYEIQLVANDSEKADRIIVRMDEDKEKDEYVVGKDLIKMGLSSLVPQIYINRYGSAMCINTAKPIHDKAEYPLGIFAPEAGEYDIFVAEASNEDVNIYLTYNGKAIWNLAYGPYTIALDKGTTNSYGLRLSAPAPQVTTGIEEAVVDAQGETRKVLINNHVFIIRGNNVYGIDGQLIK